MDERQRPEVAAPVNDRLGVLKKRKTPRYPSRLLEKLGRNVYSQRCWFLIYTVTR